MRYKVTAMIGALALTALGYNGIAQQATGSRLAYINSSVIIEETPGAQEAQETFDREMARWRTEVQALSDTLQEMISSYEQQQVMLSPEKRQERQQVILQKRVEYNQRLEELQERAQQRQQELVQPIFDKIQAVLMTMRDERGYAMVFDVAGGSLIAADTTLDITEEVIARLRTQGQAQEPGGSGDPD